MTGHQGKPAVVGVCSTNRSTRWYPGGTEVAGEVRERREAEGEEWFRSVVLLQNAMVHSFCSFWEGVLMAGRAVIGAPDPEREDG